MGLKNIMHVNKTFFRNELDLDNTFSKLRITQIEYQQEYLWLRVTW